MFEHDPTQPGRDLLWYRVGPPDIDELRPLLQAMLDLLSETDPHWHPNANRDIDARSALGLAGLLIGRLVQWSVNHQAGRIASQIGPAVLPVAGMSEDQTYRESARLANDPELEAIGAAYRYDDPVTNRRLLADILNGLSAGNSWPLFNQAAHALRGLDLGEVHELLKPAATGRHGAAHTLWNLRLRALEHAKYRSAKMAGRNKGRAYNVVASALGESSGDVLRGWEREINEVLEPNVVTRTLDMARAHGRDGDKGNTFLARWIDQLYGDAALANLRQQLSAAKCPPE